MMCLTPPDRIRGSLLGHAIGDALGAPLEGLTPQQIQAHYGQVVDYVDGARAWKRKPFRWRLPGLYTDDTQQALALVEVLIRHRRVDTERLAELYLAMANPRCGHVGAHRGVGRSFRLVIEALERGIGPEASGQDSAGISAATRIAPVALFFVDSPDAIFDAVTAASLMTHIDVRSLAGASAVASAVRRLAAGEPRTPSLLLRVAGDTAKAEDRIAAEYAGRVVGLDAYRRSVSTAVAHAESVLDLPRDQALAALVDEANRHGAEPPCRRPTRGFPPACIPACLYLLMKTDSFEDALIEVVNLGGDADSAGAILGALAGAHYGDEAIPTRWRVGLQNREALELWAEALVRRSADGLALPDLVETEHELSRREVACRQEILANQSRGGDHGASSAV